MGLRAVGLPEGVGVLVAELLDAVADFGGGEGPDCLAAYLSAGLVVYGGGRAVDEDLVGEGVPCYIGFEFKLYNLGLECSMWLCE